MNSHRPSILFTEFAPSIVIAPVPRRPSSSLASRPRVSPARAHSEVCVTPCIETRRTPAPIPPLARPRAFIHSPPTRAPVSSSRSTGRAVRPSPSSSSLVLVVLVVLVVVMFQTASRSMSRRSTAATRAATRACASSSAGPVAERASAVSSFTSRAHARSFAHLVSRHGRDGDDVPASTTPRRAAATPSTRARTFASDADEARDARDDDVVVDLDAKTTKKTSEKVAAIADRVCELTLLETHELCEVLAERLGLGDASGMMFGGGMMPMTAAGGVQGAPGGAGAGAGADAPVEEKTSFALKLESFDAAQKIKVIKEVRAVTDLGLKEAKELVEGAPAVLKKDLKKEEAEEFIAKLTAVGAKCALE